MINIIKMNDLNFITEIYVKNHKIFAVISIMKWVYKFDDM